MYKYTNYNKLKNTQVYAYLPVYTRKLCTYRYIDIDIDMYRYISTHACIHILYLILLLCGFHIQYHQHLSHLSV